MTKDTTLDIIANLHKEIEDFLSRTTHRQTFTSGEIQDFLLDLRSLSSAELKELGTENQTGTSSKPNPTVN
jgi:hypothetical protein